VRRDDLVTFHVDGTHGSAVAGLSVAAHKAAWPHRARCGTRTKQTMNFHDQWQEVPDTQVYDNGFKIQWEHFIRHVVEDAPYRWTLPEGAKGVQLVEAALQSWKERRWVDVQPLSHLIATHAAMARAGALFLPCPTGDLHELPDPGEPMAAHWPLCRLRGTRPCGPRRACPFNRIAYSAAHVVADPRAAIDPWLQCAVDWDATIAYRRHLWSLGLGVAEAMDTAQRGMGLDWPTSLELIRRSLDAARDFGPGRAGGLGLRHRPPGPGRGEDGG
jgi:hypothetical protein